MLLKELDRTAISAWSPPSHRDVLLATGRVAGTLDATFESTSDLEIFSLQLQDDTELEPVKRASLSFTARFHRLSWGSVGMDTKELPLGLLACGLDSGQVEIYNPHLLLQSKGGKDALVWRKEVASSGIRGLEFNPKQPSLLLTAAGAGDVQVWDVNALQAPIDHVRSTKISDVSFALWNPHAAHLAAVSGKNGATVLFDMKRRRDIVDLRHPQGAAAAVVMAWHPDDQMSFLTGYDTDSAPTNMCYWDLRKHNAPVLQWNAHMGGVETLAWCPRDPELLLTSGRDHRILCWNPERAECLAELPNDNAMSSTFHMQWCPRDPALFSTASFEGRLRIYSIYAAQDPSSPQQADTADLDPFSQIVQQQRQQSFSLNKAPRWLQCRHAARFAAGNQLLTFVGVSGAVSALHVHQILYDPAFAQKAAHLEKALAQGQGASYCDEKLAAAPADSFDRLLWRFLRALYEPDARRRFVISLGLTHEELVERMHALNIRPSLPSAMAALSLTNNNSSSTSMGSHSIKTHSAAGLSAAQASGLPRGSSGVFLEDEASFRGDPSGVITPRAPSRAGSLLLNPFEGEEEEEEGEEEEGEGETEEDTEDEKEVNREGLMNGHANVRPGKKTTHTSSSSSSLFQIFSRTDSEVDRLLTRAIVIGDYDTAVEICVKADRITDALMLGTCSGRPDLLSLTQGLYYEKRLSHFSRILESVQTQELSLFVQRADLDDWKDILAMVCSASRPEQYALLCDTLGERLERRAARGSDAALSHALLCYVCSGNMTRAVRTLYALMHQQIVLGAVMDDERRHRLLSFIEKTLLLLSAAGTEETLAALRADGEGFSDALAKYAELLLAHGMKASAAQLVNDWLAEERVADYNWHALRLLKYQLGLGCRSTTGDSTVEALPFSVAYLPTEEEAEEMRRQLAYQQQEEEERMYAQQLADEAQQRQLAEAQQQQIMGSGYGTGYETPRYTAAAVQQQQQGVPPQAAQYGYVQQQQQPVLPRSTSRNYHDPPFVPVKPRAVSEAVMTATPSPYYSTPVVATQPTAVAPPPFVQAAVPPRTMSVSGGGATTPTIAAAQPLQQQKASSTAVLDANAQYVLGTVGKLVSESKQRATPPFVRALEDAERKIQGLHLAYQQGAVTGEMAGRLVTTARLLEARDYLAATHAVVEAIALHYADWWIGIKRLVEIARSLPS